MKIEVKDFYEEQHKKRIRFLADEATKLSRALKAAKSVGWLGSDYNLYEVKDGWPVKVEGV